LKVTVPSKLPPPGRQASSADSVQLALAPVPTTHALPVGVAGVDGGEVGVSVAIEVVGVFVARLVGSGVFVAVLAGTNVFRGVGVGVSDGGTALYSYAPMEQRVAPVPGRT
jgi:predicted small secreted protein